MSSRVLPPQVCSPWRPVRVPGGWALERTLQTANGPSRELHTSRHYRTVIYGSVASAYRAAKPLNQLLRHWLAKMAPDQLAASDEWPLQLEFTLEDSS